MPGQIVSSQPFPKKGIEQWDDDLKKIFDDLFFSSPFYPLLSSLLFSSTLLISFFSCGRKKWRSWVFIETIRSVLTRNTAGVIPETNVFKGTGGVGLAPCMNGEGWEKVWPALFCPYRRQMCCEAWAFLQVANQEDLSRGFLLSTIQHNQNRVW